jgi:hypothetical protein
VASLECTESGLLFARVGWRKKRVSFCVILILVCPFYTILFILHFVFLRHCVSCSSEPFIGVPSKSKIWLVDTGLC